MAPQPKPVNPPTNCRNGHALTPEVVYVNPRTHVRACRLCARDRQREIYHRDHRRGAGLDDQHTPAIRRVRTSGDA
jgi:hypothetical protein